MNKITIIETITKTNKSTVSLAMIDTYDFPVILKELENANKDVYLQVQTLHNEHIPIIYECYEENNKLFVVEEYIDGVTLKEYCSNHVASQEKSSEIFRQICEAVQSLHECRPPIIHRDIKPSNILLTKEGIVKIIDFDASREYRTEGQTEDTKKLGTIEYAPPEQFGYSQTDVRSDIYAMGVVFYEMKYGKRFSHAEVNHNINNGNNRKQIQDIINKCTMFDPKNRYQSVQELILELNNMQLNKSKWLKWRYSYGVIIAFCLLFVLVFHRINRDRIEGNGIQTPFIDDNLVVSPTMGLEDDVSVEKEISATPNPSLTPNLTEEPLVTPTEKSTEDSTISPTEETTVSPTEEPIHETREDLIKEPTPTMFIEENPIISPPINPTIMPPVVTPIGTEEKIEVDRSEESIEKETVDASTENKFYDDHSVSHYYKNSAIKEELLIYMPSIEGKKLSHITCTLLGAEDRRVLSSKDYKFENNIISIKTDFLDTLSNVYYQLDASFSDNTGCRTIVRVHDEKENYVPVAISFLNSNFEYMIGKQNLLHCVLRNENGKRISSIKVNNKEVPKEHYKILYGGRALEFGSDLLSTYTNMDTVPISLIMNDGSTSIIQVKLLENIKTYPKILQGNFSINKEELVDLEVPVIWNDYPKMQFIHTLNGDDRIGEEYWYQSENSITIKKEYFQTLEAGVYEWVLEFGDIGLGINVTVFGG